MMLPLMQDRLEVLVTPEPEVDHPPGHLAEKVLADAEMLLSAGQDLGDDLESRLEALAQDPSLPKALRARALVTLCRFR